MAGAGSHAVEREPGQSRRSFLKLAGGAGLVLAARDLPAVTPSPFEVGKRGAHSRISLSYAVVEAGATKPFSALHLSDTHLAYAYPDEHPDKVDESSRRCPAFGGRQEEALRDSLAWAKNNVDYVVHTGDLIDFQSRANFDLVKKYYGPAMCGSLGNHEFSQNMGRTKQSNTEEYKAETADLLRAAYPFDIRLQSTVVNGVNFVTIDDVYGYVCPDQVERFAVEVKKGLPIILCMHVPFITPHIWLADQKFWTRAGRKFESAAVPDARGDYKVQQTDPVTRDFIAYLKTEKLLKGILAGHLHITVQDRFSPTAMQYVIGGNFLFHGEEVFFT